jgi:hypothetical protein
MLNKEQLLQQVEQSYPSMGGFTRLLLDYIQTARPICLVKIPMNHSMDMFESIKNSLTGNIALLQDYHLMIAPSPVESVEFEILSVSNLDESGLIAIEALKEKLNNDLEQYKS